MDTTSVIYKAAELDFITDLQIIWILMVILHLVTFDPVSKMADDLMTVVTAMTALMALAFLCFIACIMAFGIWMLKNVIF